MREIVIDYSAFVLAAKGFENSYAILLESFAYCVAWNIKPLGMNPDETWRDLVNFVAFYMEQHAKKLNKEAANYAKKHGKPVKAGRPSVRYLLAEFAEQVAHGALPEPAALVEVGEWAGKRAMEIKQRVARRAAAGKATRTLRGSHSRNGVAYDDAASVHTLIYECGSVEAALDRVAPVDQHGHSRRATVRAHYYRLKPYFDQADGFPPLEVTEDD